MLIMVSLIFLIQIFIAIISVSSIGVGMSISVAGNLESIIKAIPPPGLSLRSFLKIIFLGIEKEFGGFKNVSCRAMTTDVENGLKLR